MMLLGRSTSIKIIVVGLDFIKRISSELHGVTEKICQLFVSHCRICQLKKSRKSIKSFVVKPIASSSYLSRGQVDLIDFSTVSPKIMHHINGFLYIKTILQSLSFSVH